MNYHLFIQLQEWLFTDVFLLYRKQFLHPVNPLIFYDGKLNLVLFLLQGAGGSLTISFLFSLFSLYY